MDELIKKLMDKVGLSKDVAKKVAEFIKEHADDIPKWLAQSGVADKLPGGLKKLF